MKSIEAGKHLAFICGIALVLFAAICNPFLCGDFDSLALPLSALVQLFGVVGLPLAVIGSLWLMMPKWHRTFGVLTLLASFLLLITIGLFGVLSVGISFGVLCVLGLFLLGFAVARRQKRMYQRATPQVNPIPLYLISLPVLVLFFQLLAAKFLTERSRDVAISNAGLIISDIEAFHSRRGHYPLSLHAVNKDYKTGIIGIERYHYVSQGASYNLSFEQPRFLLDRFGTREWLVYNPMDDSRIHSHASWLLEGGGAEPPGGWYASGKTAHPHWQYFLFD